MKLSLIAGFFTIVSFYSCIKNEKEEFKNTISGFKYKIIPSALKGDSIKWRDVVKIELYQYVDDSLLSSTVGKMPTYVEMNNELKEFDYTELLSMMKVNDSAVCLFDIKDIMKHASASSEIPKVLKNRKEVRVLFKILNKFSSSAEALSDQEKTQISLVKYPKADEKIGFYWAKKELDSLIAKLPKTPQIIENGVYIQINEKGNGRKIKVGEEVSVISKGMLTNGSIFEEKTKENPLVIHVGMGETLKGFDAGIASLSFGDKATIYLSTEFAYGAQQVGAYIPAFSNLIFEVEIIDSSVKPKS